MFLLEVEFMISIIEGYIESWVKNRSSLKKQSSWRQRKLWLIFNDICKHNFALKRQCCLVVVVVLFWVCNKQHNKNQSAVITFIYLLLNISFKDQKLSISLYKLWVKVVGCLCGRRLISYTKNQNNKYMMVYAWKLL